MELAFQTVETGGVASPPQGAGGKPAARARYRTALLLSDLTAIAGGFLIAGLGRFGIWAYPQAVTMASLVLPLYLILNGRGYGPSPPLDWRDGLSSTAAELFGRTAIVQFVQFYLKAEVALSRVPMVMGLILSIVLLTLGRVVIARHARARFAGAPLSRLLVVDGVDVDCPSGVDRLDARRLGITPSVNDPMSLDRLARHLRGMDAVYIACPSERRRDWAMVLKGSVNRAELLVARARLDRRDRA